MVVPAKGRRIRVLESFGPPHNRMNPYGVLLVQAFPEYVDAQYFSWWAALKGDYDVFHLHWPEVFVRAVSRHGLARPKAVIRGILFLLILLRIRFGKKALVRTLHDSVPHERPNGIQNWLIGLSEKWTTLWIVLNADSEPPGGAPYEASMIGHFRDWFEPSDASPVPGTILHFGSIRPYKGVPTLLKEFGKVADPALRLRIVGAVHDEALKDEISRLVPEDSRVHFRDSFLTDDDLRSELLRCSLVVLPFTRITNSSSLLVALSLNRPVLAPSAPSIVEVANEVGDGWVHLYDGDLTAADIERAIKMVSESPPVGSPDLSLRDWSLIGEQHADAFDAALERVRQ